MNSADTRSPHLDLGDMIAEVTGQAIDDRAREHLAHCEQCRAEVKRWDLVAGGVRALTATAPEAAQPARPPHPRPPHPRPRLLAGPRRRTILAVSAAAAVVLLGAVGYGAVTALTRHAPGPVLTAVSGCPALQQTTGRLEQLNGSSLVLRAASGQPVTVTTTPSTFVSMAGPLLNEITDGASVMVRGSSSGGTITAAIITVGPPFSAVNPPGFVPVKGTVADASKAGFTVITSSGTRVRVTTAGNTLVIVPHASLGQLRHGATIFAVGHAGPDGTLSARAVTAVTQLPPGLPFGAHTHISVHTHISGHLHGGQVHGCSPSAIAAALVPGD